MCTNRRNTCYIITMFHIKSQRGIRIYGSFNYSRFPISGLHRGITTLVNERGNAGIRRPCYGKADNFGRSPSWIACTPFLNATLHLPYAWTTFPVASLPPGSMLERACHTWMGLSSVTSPPCLSGHCRPPFPVALKKWTA